MIYICVLYILYLQIILSKICCRMFRRKKMWCFLKSIERNLSLQTYFDFISFFPQIFFLVSKQYQCPTQTQKDVFPLSHFISVESKLFLQDISIFLNTEKFTTKFPFFVTLVIICWNFVLKILFIYIYINCTYCLKCECNKNVLNMNMEGSSKVGKKIQIQIQI